MIVEIKYLNHHLEIKGDYEGEQHGNYEAPSYPSTFDIHCVYFNGHDIYDFVADEILEELEELCINAIE